MSEVTAMSEERSSITNGNIHPNFEDKFSCFQISTRHGISIKCGYASFGRGITLQWALYDSVLTIECVRKGFWGAKRFELVLERKLLGV